MVFCLVIVRYLAVAAVDSSLGALFEVHRQLAVGDLLPALASDSSMRACSEVLDGVLV